MIEQILAFVLGAGSVPLIWGVAVAFKTSRKLKLVQEELPNIYERINNLDIELNRRIDREIDRVDELHKESIKHTDSRVDKLEARFANSDFELRQRINNTAELINDIAGLNIKK